MKNVTVSMDDATYMRARESASRRGRSLSALVREFLEGLKAEDEFERLRQMEQELYAKIDARARVGRASDRLDRDALYDAMAHERGE
jgi:hypothetical protein